MHHRGLLFSVGLSDYVNLAQSLSTYQKLHLIRILLWSSLSFQYLLVLSFYICTLPRDYYDLIRAWSILGPIYKTACEPCHLRSWHLGWKNKRISFKKEHCRLGNFLSDKRRIMSVCMASLFAPVSGLVGGARGGIGPVRVNSPSSVQLAEFGKRTRSNYTNIVVCQRRHRPVPMQGITKTN